MENKFIKCKGYNGRTIFLGLKNLLYVENKTEKGRYNKLAVVYKSQINTVDIIYLEEDFTSFTNVLLEFEEFENFIRVDGKIMFNPEEARYISCEGDALIIGYPSNESDYEVYSYYHLIFRVTEDERKKFMDQFNIMRCS